MFNKPANENDIAYTVFTIINSQQQIELRRLHKELRSS